MILPTLSIRAPLAAILATIIASISAGAPSTSDPNTSTKMFDVPAGAAADTFKLFIAQSRVQLLYAAEDLNGVQTQGVKGEFKPQAALDRMLAGTALGVVLEKENGGLAVRRKSVPLPTTDTSPRPRSTVPDSDAGRDAVQLSPFLITASGDKGYRATNSIGGTRTNVAIKDVPMAIQVFTEDFIRDQQAINLVEVLAYAAGVSMGSGVGNFYGDNTNFAIRGFSSDSSSILRNGFSRLRNVDPVNVDRIEVVKGPASLLYGQIDPGGVINYITKRAKPGRSGYLRQVVGSYDLLRTEAGYNHSFGRDRVRFRVDASFESSDYMQDFFKRNSVTVAPVLSLSVGPNTLVTFEYEHTTRDIDGQRSTPLQIRVPASNYFALYRTPRSFNYRNPQDYYDEALDTYGVDVQHRFNRVFTLRAYNTWSTRDAGYRTTGTALVSGPAVAVPGFPLPIPVQIGRGTNVIFQTGEQFLSQTDLAADFTTGKTKWKSLAGFEFRENEGKGRRLVARATSIAPNWNITDPSTWSRREPAFPADFNLVAASFVENQTEIRSFYTVHQVAMWENRVRTLAGIRHDEFENTGRNLVTGTPNAIVSGSRRSLQFGSLFRPLPSLALYASFSESYRPQGIKTNRDLTTSVAKPETGEGREIGIKTDFLDGRISSTIAFFHIEKSSILRSVTEFDPASGAAVAFQIEGGVERSKGVDMDVVLSLGESWQVMANAAYVDARVARNPSVPLAEGINIVDAPLYSGNLWGRYSFRRGKFKDLWLGVGLNSQGRRRLIPPESLSGGKIISLYGKSFTTFDFALGYSRKIGRLTWTYAVKVRNLEDDDFVRTRYERSDPRDVRGSVSLQF